MINLQDLEIINIPQNKDIYVDDQVSKNIYYIKSGLVSLYKLKGDMYIELDLISAGEIIGFFPLLYGDNRRITNALAVKDTVLIDITNLFAKEFETNSEIIKLSLSNLAKRLKKSYFELQKLQFFENINYEDYRSNSLKTYHIRDLVRVTSVLLLYPNIFDYLDFQNNLCILLNRVSIKIDDIINAYKNFNLLKIKENEKNEPIIEITNKKFLKEFYNYLINNFVKDYKRLVYSDIQFLLLESINNYLENIFETKTKDKGLKEEELNILRKNYIEESFSFTRESLNLTNDFQQIVFKSLYDKGIFYTQDDKSYSSEYRIIIREIFDTYNFQKIIRFFKKN